MVTQHGVILHFKLCFPAFLRFSTGFLNCHPSLTDLELLCLSGVCLLCPATGCHSDSLSCLQLCNHPGLPDEGWNSHVHMRRRLTKDLFQWRWNPRLTKAATGQLVSPNAELEMNYCSWESDPLMINSTQCVYSFKLFLHTISNWLVRALAQENSVIAITYLFPQGKCRSAILSVHFIIDTVLFVLTVPPPFPHSHCAFCMVAVLTLGR